MEETNRIASHGPDGDEPERRPAIVRQLSYDDLAVPIRGIARAPDIVPLDLVEPGDVQVRVGKRREYGNAEPVDLDRLADFPTVRSVYALRDVRAHRPLPNVEELLATAITPEPATLRNLPNLKRLYCGRLIRSRATVLDAAALPATLEALSVARHALPGGWEKRRPADAAPRFADLHAFTTLRRLTLRDCWPGDSVAPLAALTSLMELDCDAPNGWAALRTLTSLERVVAVRPKVANLKALQTWTRLRSLTLGNAGVKRLDGMGAFQALEHLTLFLLRIEDLSPLAGLPRLETITMRGLTRVTDLTPLGTLPALRRLEVERIGIGERDALRVRSLKPLVGATALEEVTMFGVTIEDGDVTALAGLPRLRLVQVYGDIETSVNALRRARPDVVVEWRPAEQRSGERVGEVYLHEPSGELTEWWMSEDLTQLLGTRTNHDAERRLVNRLASEDRALLKRLDFDTEGDAVVVRATAKVDLVAVADVITQMSRSRLSASESGE